MFSRNPQLLLHPPHHPLRPLPRLLLGHQLCLPSISGSDFACFYFSIFDSSLGLGKVVITVMERNYSSLFISVTCYIAFEEKQFEFSREDFSPLNL